MFILKQKIHFFYKPTKITFLGKTSISLLTSKLITVDSNNRTNNSFGYLKCSNPNKTPSNADANFELTRLKPDFSQTLSLQPGLNNDVFKGKVFDLKKKRHYNQLKSHQENFDSQTKLRLTKTQQ